MQNTPRVVAVGELLWDLLPQGAQFGGAPGNFAHHAALLGANVSMVSSVGDDDLGRQAIRLLKASGLDVSQVSISKVHPTGAVHVSLDAAGHASYQFNSDDAWDHLQWSDELQKLANHSDAVCFGTLGQRNDESRRTIVKFLESTPDSALRIFDINLRPPYFDDDLIRESLSLANVLKLSDDELDHVCKINGIRGSEVERAGEIAEKHELRLVAVTRGKRGGLLVCGGKISEVESQPVTVQDTVGAGDAFTAAITIGMLKGVDLDSINRSACRIAEYVCTQPGATPAIPLELRANLQLPKS